MIKVDLITGFLGSGKTTFLKKYARHFMNQGLRVGILENDYGAVNVDMLLLNELRGENCELEMVAGGADFDTHKRRFKTKLIAMAMSGYDRVIIEPSGIFDVDEFFDTLRDEPLDKWYEIGNVIAIVDAALEENLSESDDYYLASQIANAGMIILSKTNLTDQAHIDSTLSHIERACQMAKLKKDVRKIAFIKDWDRLENKDYEQIANASFAMSSYVKKISQDDNSYKTLYFMELGLKKAAIKELVSSLMTDESFGNVLRIKGFFNEDDKWYQLNATKSVSDISQIAVGQEVFIVIGDHLNESLIKDYISRLQ
ncbi:MAG: GTPase (G3E family) [Pseudobutyrivibrio sp.]|nr:GTPase (G3E family) [Pseudobutyrivibrio sp.]